MSAPRPRSLLVALIAALALAGCGNTGNPSIQASKPTAGKAAGSPGADGGDGHAELTAAGGPEAKQKAAPTPDRPDQTIDGATTVDVYFTGGEQFQPVRLDVPDDANPLLFAAENVVDGPHARELRSAPSIQTLIPEGTKVENLKLTSGRVTIEVSPRFLEGVPADSKSRTAAEQTSLEGRLAQLTFTLTAFRDVDAVRVLAGGVSLSSEKGRADFVEPKAAPPVITHAPPAKVNESSGGGHVNEGSALQTLAKLDYLPASAAGGGEDYRTQQAVTAFQAWEGLDRDGSIGPQTAAALRTAAPPRPHPGGPGRRIEIYREKGVALIVRDGRLERAIHVSTGMPGYDTPTGTYSVFRKELESYSIPFSVYLPYASYFTGGIALHEYADVPAYPASHGCVRVPSPEAKMVYRFAALGTPVVVY